MTPKTENETCANCGHDIREHENKREKCLSFDMDSDCHCKKFLSGKQASVPLAIYDKVHRAFAKNHSPHQSTEIPISVGSSGGGNSQGSSPLKSPKGRDAGNEVVINPDTQTPLSEKIRELKGWINSSDNNSHEDKLRIIKNIERVEKDVADAVKKLKKRIESQFHHYKFRDEVQVAIDEIFGEELVTK
jgi:hypothetical protein